ncbi:MAG: RagB/SusD family nutrient uptake outer membrane protein [Flavobacteriales bacterium]|nr:RagB/SusD family nutrient uptake outer membrane protein [Flavobacteriales bacterium]
MMQLAPSHRRTGPLLVALLALVLLVPGCKKWDDTNLNSPSLNGLLENATVAELNNLVTGTEAQMRADMGFYIDAVGIVGREHYRFSNSDPRYVTDLLGGGSTVLDPNGFYITNPWSARYRCIRNAWILIGSAENSSFPTAAEQRGYRAFARTVMAHQLLLNLNLTDDNGVRVDVEDPDDLGPIVPRAQALSAMRDLLEAARADLEDPSTEFAFVLSPGFEGFDDPEGFLRFNRALAARVALYQEQWTDVNDLLGASFLDPTGDLRTGVFMEYSALTSDQLNDLYYPPNASGEVRLAHPTYAMDIEAGDDRIAYAPLRNDTLTQADLSSDRDVAVYGSNTDPVPIITNEELILMRAEAAIRLMNTGDAVAALDLIRTAHGLPAYTGGSSEEELIDELLVQRRYSLFFQGHRWVDMRRYGRLGELPIDRPDDDVWSQFPVPFAE